MPASPDGAGRSRIASTRTSTKARVCRRSSFRGPNISGDYASVVATLIETFAEVAEQDALITYRELVTADRDVIRIRAIDRDHSGSLPVSAGADLVCCARDMVLAAVCSLDNPRPLYRPGANREANEYLQRVRLGQTDQGSFVIHAPRSGGVAARADVARTRHRPTQRSYRTPGHEALGPSRWRRLARRRTIRAGDIRPRFLRR